MRKVCPFLKKTQICLWLPDITAFGLSDCLNLIDKSIKQTYVCLGQHKLRFIHVAPKNTNKQLKDKISMMYINAMNSKKTMGKASSTVRGRSSTDLHGRTKEYTNCGAHCASKITEAWTGGLKYTNTEYEMIRIDMTSNWLCPPSPISFWPRSTKN